MPEPLIEPEALVEELCALIEIPSIGGTAAEVAAQQHVAQRWRSVGLEVEEWDIDLATLTADPEFPGAEVERAAAVGVIARLEGTGDGPTLMLNGHTDVVPPGDLAAWSGDPFKARRASVGGRERIIGRGACDMKAGVAAMSLAAAAIRRAGISLKGSVVLAAVSGEEDGGLGTFAMLRHGVGADMCVVPEPSGLSIVPANGGALTFRLAVHGRATHASRRTDGVSAIEKFVPIMSALADLESRRNASVDPLMARWSIAYPLSIGVVHAGDWASTVPDLLTAEGRLGVAIDEPVADARAALEHAVAEACAADPWLSDHPVDVTWWGGQFASGRTLANEPVIGLVSDVHADIAGSRPEVYGGPYGSDLRLLTQIGGIPTVQYGPGDASAAHAPDEYVEVDDVVMCANALARLIVRVCG